MPYWVRTIRRLAGVRSLSNSRYHNHLLNAFFSDLNGIQLPPLEHLSVAEGEVLQDFTQPPKWVYFPQTARISLQTQDPSGQSTELALVGNGGVTGLLQLGQADGTQHRCVVVYAGTVWRTPAEKMWEQAQSDLHLWRTLMLCNESMTNHIARTVLCNTRHSVLQSLCRWLLLMLDQAAAMPLILPLHALRQIRDMTPQQFDHSLKQLVDLQAIAMHEHFIAVLDSQSVERCSCDCYGVIQRNNESLFSSLLKT